MVVVVVVVVQAYQCCDIIDLQTDALFLLSQQCGLLYKVQYNANTTIYIHLIPCFFYVTNIYKQNLLYINRPVQIKPHFKQVITLLLWQFVFLQFTFSSKLFYRESLFVSRELFFALHVEDSAQVTRKLIRWQLPLDYSYCSYLVPVLYSRVLKVVTAALNQASLGHCCFCVSHRAISYEGQPVQSSARTATSMRQFTGFSVEMWSSVCVVNPFLNATSSSAAQQILSQL